MVKVILIIKKDTQVCIRSQYENLVIGKETIEEEISNLSKLAINSDHDQITITSQEDYEIAKEDFGVQSITFIAKLIDPSILLTQVVGRSEKQEKQQIQQIEKTSLPKVQPQAIKKIKKQKLQKSPKEAKEQKEPKEPKVKKQKKQKSKSKTAQQNTNNQEILIQDLNEEKANQIAIDEQKKKKQKKKQEKKKKQKQIEDQRSQKNLKPIEILKDLTQINESELQFKIQQFMRKFLKEQCFLSAKTNPKTQRSVNNYLQKNCCECLCKIESVPFYINNKNEFFCEKCEQELISLQNLIKIKNKDYLDQLITAKEISIFNNDMTKEELGQIQKNCPKSKLLKFIKKLASNKLNKNLIQQIQNATAQETKKKLQKKQNQQMLKKKDEKNKKILQKQNAIIKGQKIETQTDNEAQIKIEL